MTASPSSQTRAPGPEGSRLELLQLLRFIAALMIVVLHGTVVAEGIAVRHLPIQLGAGVDLFFVISGFVITFTSQRYLTAPGGWSQFLVRRLIRILPLYWSALTLRLVLLSAAAVVGVKEAPTFAAVLTSYLFIPYDSMGYGPAYPFPILDLGWTLNYEMFFYAVFAAAIFLARGRAVGVAATFLVAGVAVTSLWKPGILVLDFWFRPIVLEFIAGMLIAVAYGKGFRLPLALAPFLVIAALCLWTLIDMRMFESYGGPGFYSFPRFFVFGGGAICLIMAATLLPRRALPAWLVRLSVLGDSSYTLYLVHPFLFGIYRAVLARLDLPVVFYWPVLALMVAGAVFLAHVAYLKLEAPAMGILRRRILSGKSVARPTYSNP
ncbi:acyltransferase family protein [Rhizobium binxianense]